MSPIELQLSGMRCEKRLQPIEGSIRGPCRDCRKAVWITPAALEVAVGSGMPYVVRCHDCANPNLGKTHTLLPQTPSQRAELARHRGKHGHPN